MILYQHDHASVFRFQVLGELRTILVRELEGCWTTARPTIGHRKVIVDLSGVTGWDEAAIALLSRMHHEGAELAGSGTLGQELIRLVVGEPDQSLTDIPAETAARKTETDRRPRISRWRPVRVKTAD
jgi:hypothetical protein